MMSFILVLEMNDETANPPGVIPLLSEFSDVISDEILLGLPPMRDIQHAINFVLGAGTLNSVADALSRRHVLLTTLQTKIVRFDLVKELYQDDSDFCGVWVATVNQPFHRFYRHDRFLFPQGSLREAIIWKAYDGGLAGHFGRDKTVNLVKENFYWPRLKRDANRHIQRYRIYHLAKSKGQNTGLYMPLPIPEGP
ncbi:uncharacterized protein LOC129316515 [Prosopis cineraria]|uniref:uncharacterized protein LOC129316515 n=1 Tax=Prosopis cineraria TaxID=364024 RepID=UPI002410AE1F|nr:uncharacterized protein LOC129316515 [Prosopis cineraria]